jgi:cobalt-zinc-cadmium efflux system membrane fusion protein
MKRSTLVLAALLACAMLSTVACGSKAGTSPTGAGDTGPRTATVELDLDANNFKVEHPEQFALAEVGETFGTTDLNVTGAVSPDISRQVPVPSLASGRVVEINARLGDEVKKGQLLFKVRSSDIAGAFSDYRKAVKNEELARIQLDRAKLLFSNGAIPKSALEVAENAEDNANVDVETTIEHLKLLGSDPDHPTGIVPVYAPVAGVITDQQITNGSGVQALAPPNPFTISDITHVWIICDVYENDLAQVRLGEAAEIRLNAFPDRVLRGRISNIGQIMDPNLRTAKIRIEVDNPALMRFGMFVTANFHGVKKERRTTVPASAILHLHDRDGVYIPLGGGRFRRLEVKGGRMLPGNMQEIVSGLAPGAKVVANALVLQNTVDQQ